MGLSVALSNALSGMRAGQASLDVLSRNVANSGTYDHRRERIKQAYEAPLAEVASAYEQRFGQAMRLA